AALPVEDVDLVVGGVVADRLREAEAAAGVRSGDVALVRIARAGREVRLPDDQVGRLAVGGEAEHAAVALVGDPHLAVGADADAARLLVARDVNARGLRVEAERAGGRGGEALVTGARREVGLSTGEVGDAVGAERIVVLHHAVVPLVWNVERAGRIDGDVGGVGRLEQADRPRIRLQAERAG